MLADVGGERLAGMRMNMLAVPRRCLERPPRIAVRLGDRIDCGGRGLRERPDPDDACRAGAGSQLLQAREQARGEVVVTAGRYDDHVGPARHPGGDRCGADADLHVDVAFAKEPAQILGDRIPDNGTGGGRMRWSQDCREGKCSSNEEAHGREPEMFLVLYRNTAPFRLLADLTPTDLGWQADAGCE